MSSEDDKKQGPFDAALEMYPRLRWTEPPPVAPSAQARAREHNARAISEAFITGANPQGGTISFNGLRSAASFVKEDEEAARVVAEKEREAKEAAESKTAYQEAKKEIAANTARIRELTAELAKKEREQRADAARERNAELDAESARLNRERVSRGKKPWEATRARAAAARSLAGIKS